MTDEHPRIDLGGASVLGLERGQISVLLAHGHRTDEPWLAEIMTNGRIQAAQVPGRGLVRSLSYDEHIEAVVDGRPPRLVVGDFPDGFSPMNDFTWDDDVDVTDAVAAWTTCGDEDSCYLKLLPDGRLMAAEIGIEEFTLAPPGLFALSEPLDGRDLVVTGAEIGLLVAGAVGRRGSAPGQRLWRYGARGYPGIGEDGWQEVSLDVMPDGFTDAYSTHDPTFAGHLAGRPVVYDCDGHLLDVPDVVLDAEHPQVCVARGPSIGGTRSDPGHVPPSRGLVIAVQSAEGGPELWARGERTWLRSPAPSGRLVASRIVDGGDNEESAAWVVVDGDLYRVDLAEPAE